jgi:HEAT repeat protein
MRSLGTVVASAALILCFAGPVVGSGIETPPDGYWGDYRTLRQGWLDEFNKYRSERGLPTFVWSDRLYVVLVEFALEAKSHDLELDQLPGPCERPTRKARRIHRWNIYFWDNYTLFPKASYTPQEAIKSLASVAIIKSIRDPRNNAAAVVILERNPNEVYIMETTACIDLQPVREAQELLEINGAILDSPEATSADRVQAIREMALRKNFELAFTFMKYMLDRDGAVAKTAVEGLAVLGDPSFVLPLINALDKAVPEAREAIAATLAKITRRREFGTDAARWRKWYGVSGGTVTRPFEVPSEEIKLSEEEVKKLVEDFKLELKNPDSMARVDAVRQVGRIRHTDIAKAIAKALTDKDPAVRKTAAEALAYQADKATMKALCKTLPLNKGKPDVQAAILKALGAIGDWRALPAVTKDLMRPGQPEVTKARIVALGNIRHRDSIQNLIDFMQRWGRAMRDYAKPLQESLKKLTGKDFGRNRNAWKAWWDRSKKTWRFPRKK